MATIKNKHSRAKLASPARAIHSIIVPLRKKNRGATIACQDFQNRTISVNLFPNVRCSISELPATASGILDLWRKITNNDIRYQQRQNALPAFLGCRDICVKCSSATLSELDVFEGIIPDFDCFPYIRLTMDNIQVAVFIIMAWCNRTGQMPLEYNVVYVTNGKLSTTSHYLNKSNPYLFEKLLELKNVHSIKFGAVAEIVCHAVDRETDLYNIPGVRVSQKFGHQLNVYAMRKVVEVREALQRGEIKRMRNLLSEKHNKAVARLEYNERKAKLRKAGVSLSNYGGYTYYYHVGTRYCRAYNRTTRSIDAVELTHRTNEALAQIHAPEILKPIVGAEPIIAEVLRLKRVAQEEHKRRLLLEHEVEELQQRKEQQPVEPYKFKAISDKGFRNKTQLKDYVLTEASFIKDSDKLDKNCRNISPQEITDAVATLIKSASDIQVDHKDGQLIIKF